MHESWLAVLGDELEQPYMHGVARLPRRRGSRRGAASTHRPIAVFNALALTPFDDVRVVILGQDPYHGAGQAMGPLLLRSRRRPPAPSLQNIHQELETDLGLPRPRRATSRRGRSEACSSSTRC
jgi:uracil-DNA glycosylase